MIALFLASGMGCPLSTNLPASVAQLDARLNGDQEVAGSIPATSAAFFRGDLIMKYFLRSFFPFR